MSSTQEMLHLIKEYYLIENNIEYIVKNQFDHSLPFTLPLKNAQNSTHHRCYSDNIIVLLLQRTNVKFDLMFFFIIINY